MTGLIENLKSLGKISNEIPYPLFTTYTIQLSRPVPTYEPAASPDCLFINSELWACTRHDYLRTMGSVCMERQEIIQVRFVNRPIAWWIGYGRLRKKAVEGIEVAVYGDEIGDFVRLARVGFAYEGATKRRRKK